MRYRVLEQIALEHTTFTLMMGGETICEYMTFCVTREFKKVSSIQDAVEWMDKKMNGNE